MKFSTLLSQMRRSRGLTREQLAQRSGVSTQTVYRAERDQNANHFADTITRFCRALDAVRALTTKEMQTIEAVTGMNPDALLSEEVQEKQSALTRLARAKSSPDTEELISLLEHLLSVCDSLEDAASQLRFLIAYKGHQSGRTAIDLTQHPKPVVQDTTPPMAIKRDEKIIDDGLMAETVTIYSKPPPQPPIPDKRQPRRRAAGE